VEFDGLGNVPHRVVAAAQVTETAGLAFEAAHFLVYCQRALVEFDGLGKVPQRSVAEAQVPEPYASGLAFLVLEVTEQTLDQVDNLRVPTAPGEVVKRETQKLTCTIVFAAGEQTLEGGNCLGDAQVQDRVG